MRLPRTSGCWFFLVKREAGCHAFAPVSVFRRRAITPDEAQDAADTEAAPPAHEVPEPPKPSPAAFVHAAPEPPPVLREPASERPSVASAPVLGAESAPMTEPVFRGPLEAALRHPILALLPVVALVAAGAAVGLLRAPTYSAKARINVGRVDVPAYTLQNVIAGNATLAGSYARAATAPAVVAPAARAAHMSPDMALSNLSATQVPGTTLITVNADGSSAAQAVALANAGGRGLIDYITALTRQQEGGGALARFRAAQLRTDRARIRYAKIAHREPSHSAALQQARLDVLTAQLRSQSLSTKYVAGEAGPDPQNLMQLVGPATAASSDRTSMLERLILVGLAVGIILGLALALVRANRSLLTRRTT